MKLYVRSNVTKAAYGERITREEIFELAEKGMVGMVSAFRGYLSDAENNKRTEELRTLIGTCGYDVAEIKGKYQEEGSGEISEEKTLIVISDKKQDTNNINEFRTDMLGFSAKFQQDSIFIIYGNDNNSCIGELWERESKFEWGSEESITEVVKRGEYTLMKRFTHIAPERVFANTVCSNYCQNILRMESKMFSGSSSRAKIIEARRKLYNSTM